MATYQRVALYILFDSIENDLVHHIRSAAVSSDILVPQEREKAKPRVNKDLGLNYEDDFDLLFGLDLGDKFAVLLRLKSDMSSEDKNYFSSLIGSFEKIIVVRNDIMHGRSLTMEQQVIALAFAQSLLRKSAYWPRLAKSYVDYNDNPTIFLQRSVKFLDNELAPEVLHNLPVPDYDDTGFLSRRSLEQELKKKVLGRNPVITILGEGGNGKTALALQVLYNLVKSADHDFDAIIWTSAKTTELAASGIKQLAKITVEAVEIMNEAAFLEIGDDKPTEKLRKFLEDNKVLLVIDNYETVVGHELAELAQDVPGSSKILFTSRRPIGGDLTVTVGELSEKDALTYFRRLVDVYAVGQLRKYSNNQVSIWLSSLSYKPLLIKWLVLGVKSGIQPSAIAQNPDAALKFCLDNVILNLGQEAQAVIVVLATLPSAVAPSIIQEVSKLRAVVINDGLAELTRYGLVGVEITSDGAQLFTIKPFSRSYIQRLIKPKQEIVEGIISNYQKIESQFQIQKGLYNSRKYSQSYLKAVTKSQVIIAEKLKSAIKAADAGEFDVAEIDLFEAKSLEPTYFECHKAEAIIAISQNDWNRAISCFETSINLAPDEPQVHFAFATLLMKMIENERAAEEFEAALALERNSLVLREAARNCYMMCNFNKAQSYISEAIGKGNAVGADMMKLVDVQSQIYVRKIEFLKNTEAYDEAIECVLELYCYLEALNPNMFDEKMVAHLLKVLPSLRNLLKRRGPNEHIAKLMRFLDENLIKVEGGIGERVENTLGMHQGILKKDGRKVDYGFLSSNSAPDAFAHITRVSQDLWERMCLGSPVRYDIAQDERERIFAYNISEI